jgi:hypothetical protein
MEYKYSILGNVTAQVVKTSRLHDDIKNNLTLSSATFRGVVTKEDELYVLFSKNIETSEKTSLDTIVQDHTPVALPQKSRHIPYYPSPKDVSESFYTTTGCFVYPGDTPLTTITSIETLSMMSPGSQSYDIQIVNRDTNSIIAEQNFTNTAMQLNTFSTVHTGNLSGSQFAIEVLARLNKQGSATNKVVHIDQVVFWLD